MSNHARRSAALTSAVLGVALGLAACGGGSSADTASTTKSAAAAGGAAAAGAKDAAIAAKVPEAVRKSGKLTVATEGAYPPFELFDTDGKTLIGVDPELATAVAGVLGLKVDLVNVKFDAIIPGMAAKRYDMGTSAFTDTAAREKIVDFVTYFKGGSSLLTVKGNPMKLTLENLCGKRLAVQKGTIYESDVVPALEKKYCTGAGKPAIKQSVYPGQPETILAVGNGRADATLNDFAPLAYAAKKSNGKFEVLQQQYEPAEWGFALLKGSGLTEPVHLAMQKLIKDGTYTKIITKWEVTGGAVTESKINVATGG